MSAPNHELPGAEAAFACLEATTNCKNQGDTSTALVALLDSLSGSGAIATGARRGAAAVLANVIERGLAAVCADRG